MSSTARLRLLVTLGGVAALVFFALQCGPQIADRLANRVRVTSPHAVDARAQAMYDELLVADLHGDSLLWDRDLTVRNGHGAIDLPRLIEGNVAIQCFFLVTKTPYGLTIDSMITDSDVITLLAFAQGWPRATWSSVLERALFQTRRLRRIAVRSNGVLSILKTKSDLEAVIEARARGEQKVAAVIGVEGAHVLEGDLGHVQTLFDEGVRIIAPTHLFDNDVGGSAHGAVRGGLTALGRALIRDMDARGILLDLAHASEQTFEEALALATKPVVVSHTGVRGTCDSNRNLSDAQVRAIAATGGVVGIGYWERAVCGDTPADIARAIEYASSLVGVEYVALGSDFDGAVPVPFDTTGLALLVEALLERGFTEAEIRLIMGGNALRVLSVSLPD